MAANLPELGGAGLVSHLYEYLWSKNNLLQTRCMYHKCPPVLIPDTITLKNKLPTSWYFSSLKTGSLQRRLKDLNVKKVTEALVRRQDPNVDIVAVFVGSAQGDVQPITEYLSAEGLDYFLSTPPSRRTKVGMLQSFIHPKGTSNFIIRVSWAPDECTMNSCININRLSDPDLEVQERAATNDEKHCVLIPMAGNVLAKQLERLCETIAEHLHLASQQQYKVSSMVINFKIDNEDRVWLLWCEQLEVADELGNKLPRQVLAPEQEEPHRAKGSAKRDDSKHEGGSPSGLRSSQGPKPTTASDRYGDGPEMVDDDEDDEDEGRGSRPTTHKSRGADDEDDEEEEERPGLTPFEHEEVDPSDFVLLPEGAKERTSKPKGKGSKPKRPPPKVQDDSTPRSDDVSGSDVPAEERRPARGKAGSKDAGSDRQWKKKMLEEKKRREEAERRIVEQEELLKRAEARAKAAEDKRKRAKQPASTLPKVQTPGQSTGPRPSSKGPQQAPLKKLEDATAGERESTARMADEVVKAADIDVSADDGEGEADTAALDEMRQDKEAAGDDSDPWERELGAQGEKPLKYHDDIGQEEEEEEEDSEEEERMGGPAAEAGAGQPEAAPARPEPAEEATGAAAVDSDGAVEPAAEESAVAAAPESPQATTQAGAEEAKPTSGQAPTAVPAAHAEPEAAAGAELEMKEPVVSTEPPRQSAFDDDEGKTDGDAQGEQGSAAATTDPPADAEEESQDRDAPADDGDGDGREHGDDEEKREDDEAYDPDEYEDKPIGDAQAIKTAAPHPKGRGAAKPSAGASAPEAESSPAVAAEPTPTFAVEVAAASASGQAQAPPPPPPPAVPPRSEEEEDGKCKKSFSELECTAAGTTEGQHARTPGKGPESKPSERNWEGDELQRDTRMVFASGALHFRSEIRVGTSSSKWVTQSVSTVMDGQRIGSTSTVFGAGGEGMSISSMFDDDGLQPPHMQALVHGQVQTGGVQDDSQRCGEVTDVAKSIPNPIPDFHKPVDEPGQTLQKDGVLNQADLPVRKGKGKADKLRETRVEMICTPIAKNLDADSFEDPLKLKAELGLPDCLWEHDEHRSDKFLASKDQDLVREESDSRFLPAGERLKGDSQTYIDTASFQEAERSERGFAAEVMKMFGNNARTLEGDRRDVSTENISKNAEWAYDEYLRHEVQEVEQTSKPPDGEEKSEVIDVKFDVAFNSDEERVAFAKAQRAKLAKALGIPAEYIEVAEVRPGSPITLIRFQIKGSDAAMIPVPDRRAGAAPAAGSPDVAQADDGGGVAPAEASGGAEAVAPAETEDDKVFDLAPLEVSMAQMATEDSHRQLSARLKSKLGEGVPVEDRAVTTALQQSAPDDMVDTRRAYGRESATQARFESRGRTKGDCDQSVPGIRFEEPVQLNIYSGEHESTGTSTAKNKGNLASLDDDGVDRVYKPGREMMVDDQFSSAKVQRRPPKPAKRLLDMPLAQDGEIEEQVKVPYEEVDNTRRLKELEDELKFRPAERAVMGPRTAIMARKDEGLEDHRWDKLDEFDSRIEEKRKEDASRQPSLKLTKAIEETEYELAQKVTGMEDPRTTVPCEPAGLSTGDRRQKKKGKDGDKLHVPAVPEAYMAFGTEGESQRLAPSVVTLEKPGMDKGGKERDIKTASSGGAPELLGETPPDIVQMKFDVSFVDEKSRLDFAETQRMKLARLLKIPEEAIAVRMAVPGSPITIVTYEIVAGTMRRIPEAPDAPVSKPFDNAVLDVGVQTPQDDVAEALIHSLRALLGTKVPIARTSTVPGKGGAPTKEKNVKFASAGADEPVPAYMRTREELEDQAQRHHGVVVSDKEAVEVADGMDEASRAQEDKKRMAESGLDDKKPVLAYDRRLPKNAKNKQHLLSRIHTIESTLQRLYGKLEADTELPDMESIEQIMSSTIKQTVYQPDPGVHDDDPAAASPLAKAHAPGGVSPVSPMPKGAASPLPQPSVDDAMRSPMGTAASPLAGQGEEGPGEAGLTDSQRRDQVRAERRQRMEEKERMRAEKAALDLKPRGPPGSGGGVRFEGERSEALPPADMSKLRALQDEEELQTQPPNLPAVPDGRGREEEEAGAERKGKKQVQVAEEDAGPEEALVSPAPSEAMSSPLHKKKSSRRRSKEDDEGVGLSREEMQQMAAADEATTWKSVFSKVRHGKKDDVVKMLDSGCPVDLKDGAGNTLLNVAAQNGHKSIIKALLRRGSDINTQNHKGQTPLHFCFTYGFNDLGNYLISKGADDTIQNFAGLTCQEGLGD